MSTISDEKLFDKLVVKIDDDSKKRAYDLKELDRMMLVTLICCGSLFVVGSTLVFIITSLVSMLCG